MTLLSFTARVFTLGTALLLANTAHAAPSPATAGGERVCAYTSGLSSWSYSSARVTYPCTLSKAAYPATTLTGGFSNTKEQMTWLSEHLSSHGYIVITITPNNIFGAPTGWESAHKAGIAKLKSERSRSASPLYNKIDLSKLSLAGFSMGGGGALLAAADLGSQVKVAVPMAPYLGFNNPNYSAINANVLIQAGANDTVAFPSTVASYYQSLPTGISRALTTFRDATHLDWINTGNTTRQARLKTLVTSWLKVYLDGNTDYATYLDGAEHNRHLAEDWFTRFEYVR